MSQFNIEQKTIRALFCEKKADFLIPDYQRPYEWGEQECQAMWDDFFMFAFPDDNCDNFDSDDDDFFLGPIVIFKNTDSKWEIIDGQQRITTIMLLLRAFYRIYEDGNMRDDKAIKTSKFIEQCIWKTNEFGDPDKSLLKITSDVISEKEKEEFYKIMLTGVAAKSDKSNYADAYRFFQQKIDEFLKTCPDWFSFLPIRIMNNCSLMPIDAVSSDKALDVFYRLNDRGKSLTNADFFKTEIYKSYASRGEEKEFARSWMELRDICSAVFRSSNDAPMDELFIRYMYYERAKQGNKSSRTEALKKFYERDSYALLKKKETFENLIDLAHFWYDVKNQDTDRFSNRVLKKLFVLNYAPNSMWEQIVSVYYLAKRDENGILDDDELYTFLNKTIAFIFAYCMTHPGFNALRTPIYTEMYNIVNDQPVTFSNFQIDKSTLRYTFENFVFSNNKLMTKAILTWWAYNDPKQELLPLEKAVEIEHIYARNRYDNERSLSNPKNVESIGNKSLLEKRINIRASDYRFVDKKKYYKGYINNRNQEKEGTNIIELRNLAYSAEDFTESDIVHRKAKMYAKFESFVRNNALLKGELPDEPDVQAEGVALNEDILCFDEDSADIPDFVDDPRGRMRLNI